MPTPGLPRRVGAALARFGRRPGTRRAGAALAMLVVTAVGMVVAVLLAGKVTAEVGPFHAELSITPALRGGTDVAIPPLGSLHLATHYGPAHLSIHLNALDERRTRALVSNPNSLEQASGNALTDLKAGIFRLVFQVAGVTVLGAMLFAALVYRRMRRVATAGATALGLLLVTGGIAYGTFRPGAIEEPRYEGLLVNAPAVVGNAREIAGRYSEYRAELQRLVQNVDRLYDTISTLPVYEPDTTTIRVLHISDMHLNPAAWSVVRTVVAQFHIQLVIDTGDLTDWGSEPEDSYVANIAALKVPYVFIRGNHDSVRTAAAVARQPNATVLDGGTTDKDGLLIAGIGDPRFTPDKSTPENAAAAKDAQSEAVVNSGRILADSFVGMDRPPDIALVHDPAAAGPLAGTVPLVLAGHLHKREVSELPRPAHASALTPQTLLMVEGSTGGAGLRGLEAKTPLPLALSVLYFDHRHALRAYDDITVGGTGQTQVNLQRHIIKEQVSPGPSDSPSPPS